jgi:hypothetical protein
MAANFVLLEKVVVGTATAASVTFNSIPQTGYTDLKIIASISQTGTSTPGTNMYFNGTNTNIVTTYLESYQGGSSGTRSGAETSGNVGTNTSTAHGGVFSQTEIYIPDYANTSYQKTFGAYNGYMYDTTQFNYINHEAGKWSSTAAINSITFVSNSGRNFVAGTSFSLYGISRLNVTPLVAPKATGGDVIQSDGTYWYHAFLASGTFTPALGLTCDVLIVAGGGSGGYSENIYNTGGGGGAGGVAYTTGNSIAATAQTVTVGAGASATVSGLQGSNSVFGSLTAAVGGGAGGNYGGSGTQAGGNGGSGGGARGLGPFSGGTATSGQGFAGGNNNGSRVGAGGGGGGAVGQSNTSEPNGGNGGAGTNTYSSWLSTTGLGVSGYIAGGGGGGNSPAYGGATGGVGGSGGGGTSSPTSGAIGGAGTANTGSGGGAGTGNGAQPYWGGNGGSGLVIIRYPIA